MLVWNPLDNVTNNSTMYLLLLLNSATLCCCITTDTEWQPRFGERNRFSNAVCHVSASPVCWVNISYLLACTRCVSDILYELVSHSLTRLCVCVNVCVGGCFVLLADSSPPRVGPGRCRGVTMLINCLRSPVCVAACLPCRCVLGGFRGCGVGVKKGGSWKGEGTGSQQRDGVQELVLV